MEKKIELGQKITIDHVLERKHGISELTSNAGRVRKTKYWQKAFLKSPIKVFVVGKRTLSNGFIDYEPEYGNVYTHKDIVTALLVVSDINKNPFYVSIDKTTIK